MLLQTKNYLKLCVLLFGISIVLVNCQKDDYEISETSGIVSEKPFPFEFKTKTYNELSKDSKFNTAIDKVFNIKNGSSNARTVMEEQYSFTIDSSLIKEISSNSYTSYTMYIYREQQDDTFYENLVVEIDSTNTIRAYIIKHTPNSTSIYNVDHDSYSVNTLVEVTSIEYNISETARLSNDCIPVTTWYCNWTEGNVECEEHLAGPNCTPEFMYEKTTECPDSGGDSDSSTGGTEDGSTGGTEDDSSNDTSCDTCGASGGGTTGETSTTDDVTASVLSPEEVSFNSFIEGLDPELQFWINQIDQRILKSSTFDYLKANFFSTEAEAFAELAIVEGLAGSTVDFATEIINGLTGKALCVYNKLKSTSTSFTDAIQKFDGDFPVSHLSFIINNSLSSGNYGTTSPP